VSELTLSSELLSVPSLTQVSWVTS